MYTVSLSDDAYKVVLMYVTATAACAHNHTSERGQDETFRVGKEQVREEEGQRKTIRDRHTDKHTHRNRQRDGQTDKQLD